MDMTWKDTTAIGSRECRSCTKDCETRIADLKESVAAAQREADLRAAQLLMIGSQLSDDPKMDCCDRSDPRWTLALRQAGALCGQLRRLLSAIDSYRRDLNNCSEELARKNQVLCDRDDEHRRVCAERDRALAALAALGGEK